MARIDRPVSRRQSLWLLLAAIATCAPLTAHMPLWLSLGAGATLLWRGLLSWQGWRLPARWLLILLVAIGSLGVFLEYRSLFGRTPGIALLLIFLSLKLLELRAPRDAVVSVLLCYFLILGQFLFTQTIPTALLTGIAVIITTAALLAANDDRPTVLQQLRRTGLLLLQALPFMLLLFMLFPRINGPLWGLPEDRRTALSGLSETMSPGSIAQLSQSDEIAFRVRFSGSTPAQSQLYWRGPVLPIMDGRTWRMAPFRHFYTTPPYPLTGKTIDYELTLEPHGKRWLFALELPATLPPESALTGDYQLLTRQIVRNRLRYTQRAIPEAVSGQEETPEVLRESLRLPADGNPRTRAVAQTWRQRHVNDEAAILNTANDFFARQLLIYTLNPPLAERDPVDEFLFDSKRGFCEHFAAAFTVAMRAAGIPARVVTGYQGGEINPVDGYLVVRQYDAHAWSEVWLAGHGWIRVDPTAISAPRRIDSSITSAISADEAATLLANQRLAWLRTLRYQLDAVTNGWNQWVLGYNPQRQRDLLNQLGLNADWRNMTALLAVLCGIALLLLTAWILRQRQRPDPALVAWRHFTKRLARRGVVWQVWEGPLAFAARAMRHLPMHAASINDIAQGYISLRYAAHPQAADLALLKTKIAHFKP
jgi:transglutaminase-like putative cysteine protease